MRRRAPPDPAGIEGSEHPRPLRARTSSFTFDSEDNLYGLRPSGPPRVQKVDQSGSVTETFGAGRIPPARDIAVNKATGTVYVTDGASKPAPKDVHIFKAFTVPNSITEQFAPDSQTSGTSTGKSTSPKRAKKSPTANSNTPPKLSSSPNEFDGATKVPCDEGTTFTANESVSAEVAGLTLEEPYIFRLVTENANGASNGRVRKFVPHAVVDLTTKPATNVAPRSATLNASFSGNGDGTEYFFEVGHGPAGVYTESTPRRTPAAPSGATPISFPVSNLELETTYHYRVVAVNGTGDQQGLRRVVHDTARGRRPDDRSRHRNRPGDGHPERKIHRRRPRHQILLRIRADQELRAAEQRGPVRRRDHLRADAGLE